MNITTAMTDVNYFISAIDECQLNMNNLGHEWYIRACDRQTLLDATGYSTSGDNYTARTPHRNTTYPQNIYDSVHHRSAK